MKIGVDSFNNSSAFTDDTGGTRPCYSKKPLLPELAGLSRGNEAAHAQHYVDDKYNGHDDLRSEFKTKGIAIF